ncbi:MAG: T9SS type A sorting domain-containing protein [Bacteroidota bacterium]
MRSYRYKILLLACFTSCRLFAQIPVIGDSNAVEIANWNIEWFGKTGSGYGPSDEALQRHNVKSAIRATKIDLWGLCEIANTNAFDSLLDSLPEYAAVVSPYFPEQKTGVLYNTSRFSLISSELLGTQQKDSFTTGRYPFLVALKPLFNTSIDTLFVIVLHIKANIGNSSEKLAAYNSRLRSSEWLQMYLFKTMTKRYCMVLGDWNDDIDASIFNALPSPYVNLRDNTSGFTFTTQKFTDNHIGTTTAYPDAIDHQYISSPLKKLWMSSSTELLKLNQHIANYSTTTSDHYPVYSLFKEQSSDLPTVGYNGSIILYPNPSSSSFSVHFDGKAPIQLQLFNAMGQCLLTTSIHADQSVDTSNLPSGIYTICINCNGKISTQLISILH